ncbi:hemolysin XhlA family protein [Lihuaxuella thermophila]|uniref:Haemolysin XhlA n=1 Tax=Lihuaxuella thermophila TaxID=1173111 RepID=A0A1H8JGB6_9BACL|nr:hemolysin XhlA family protein [Lihuaxuella thermophila]SEN79722.1 Haemolysin XhlA [Lihuaxuella thermophila]
MTDNGVVISTRELYDMIQEMARSLQRIEARLDQMEEKMESALTADERSREALNKAEDALELARKLEDQLIWMWRIIAGAIATGAIGALFLFAQKGIIGG